MASTLHLPVGFTGSLASKTSASELLCSSRNGVCGVTLKAFGKARLDNRTMTINMKKRETPFKLIKESAVNGRIRKKGPSLNEMIENLQREIDDEYSQAAKALGLEEKMVILREEFAKIRNSDDQSMLPALKEELEQLMDELNESISAAPNYATLQDKLHILQDMLLAQNYLKEVEEWKKEINMMYKVIGIPDLKKKIKALMPEIKMASTVEDLDQVVKEKLVQLTDNKELYDLIDAVIKCEVRLDEIISAGPDKTQKLPENSTNANESKEVISKRRKEIFDCYALEKKIETVTAELKSSGASTLEDLDPGLKKKTMQLMNELGPEIIEMIFSGSGVGHDELNADIMETTVSSEGSSSSLLADNDGSKSEVKINVAKAGKTPVAMSEAPISSEGSKGSLRADNDVAKSEVEVNADANQNSD